MSVSILDRTYYNLSSAWGGRSVDELVDQLAACYVDDDTRIAFVETSVTRDVDGSLRYLIAIAGEGDNVLDPTMVRFNTADEANAFTWHANQRLGLSSSDVAEIVFDQPTDSREVH